MRLPDDMVVLQLEAGVELRKWEVGTELYIFRDEKTWKIMTMFWIEIMSVVSGFRITTMTLRYDSYVDSLPRWSIARS
jgi:hypothetical protein